VKYDPAPWRWSQLSWPVWLALAAYLVALPVLSGNAWVSVPLALMVAGVALLRIRERRRRQ
jgi:hypothetical protein